MYNVDTDISDIMVNAGEQKSSFIPREEWNRLSDEVKERLIAKRRQERLNSASAIVNLIPQGKLMYMKLVMLLIWMTLLTILS